MIDQTRELGTTTAALGTALSALDVDEWEHIAAVQVEADHGKRVRVRLQLNTINEPGRALASWAARLAGPVITGAEFSSYMRLSVAGTLGGTAVEVWTHVRGARLLEAGCVLSVPVDGQPHRVPFAALRQLAEHEAANAHV